MDSKKNTRVMSPSRQQKQKPKITKPTTKSTGAETKRSTRSTTRATKLVSETVSTKKEAAAKLLPKTRGRTTKTLATVEKTPKLKKEITASSSKVTKLKKTPLTEMLDLPLTSSKKAAIAKCIKPTASNRVKPSGASQKKTAEKTKPKKIKEESKSKTSKTATKKISTARITKTTKADNSKIKKESKPAVCETGVCPFKKVMAKKTLKCKSPIGARKNFELKRKLNTANCDLTKKVKVHLKRMTGTSIAKPWNKLVDYSDEDDEDELFDYSWSSFSLDDDDDDDENDDNPGCGICTARHFSSRSTCNSKNSNNSRQSSQTTKRSNNNGSTKSRQLFSKEADCSENETNPCNCGNDCFETDTKYDLSENSNKEEIKEFSLICNENTDDFKNFDQEKTKKSDEINSSEDVKQNDMSKSDAVDESENNSKGDQNDAADTDDFEDSECNVSEDVDEYIQEDTTENDSQGDVCTHGNFVMNSTQNNDSEFNAYNKFDDVSESFWSDIVEAPDKSMDDETENDEDDFNQTEQNEQNSNTEDDGKDRENSQKQFSDQNVSNDEMEVDDAHDGINFLDDDNKPLNMEIIGNKSRFYNSSTSYFVVVLLKDEIFIEGAVLVGLVSGSIDIFGYKPKILEVTEIISPMGHNSISIKPMNNFHDENNDIDKIMKQLFCYDCINFDFSLIKNDLKNFYNYKTDAIIILQKDTGRQIQLLKKIMKEHIFIDVEKISKKRQLNLSELILQCIINDKDDIDNNENCNNIKTQTNWQYIEIEQNTKLMVIGGKGVGKSTLLRYLINSNLQKFKKFLFIDLDIGQPEIFLPQTISATIINKPLLGPGYYYNLKSDKTFVFSDTNIIMSPIYYLKLVKNLLLYCKKNNRYQNIPWFINTMGYSKGIGNEIISVICKLLRPTDIVQIQCNKDNNNYGFIMDTETVLNVPKLIIKDENVKDLIGDHDGIQFGNNASLYKYHKLILLESVVDFNHAEPKINKNSSSRDKRYERLVLHCNSILNDEHEWFTDIVPYETSLDKTTLISLESDDTSIEDILKVINANIVYLCERASSTCVECYGMGIIRSVDFETNKIYLLTSLPTEILRKVTTLVVSKAQMPTSILLNQGPKTENIAPFIYSTNNNIATRQINPVYNKPLNKN